MFYKILKGTTVFDELEMIFERGKDARKKVHEVVKMAGADDAAADTGRFFCGGIVGFTFKKIVPADKWREVGHPDLKLWFPRHIKENAKLLNAIATLPTIHYNEIGEIIGFDGPQTVSIQSGLRLVNIPQVSIGKLYALIFCERGLNYKPITTGITEILSSEFDTLFAQLKEEYEKK